MAEVVATFAALSSVLQVVDFTTRIGKHAYKLVTSGRGAEEDHLETETLAKEFAALALGSPTVAITAGGGSDQDTATLLRLRQRCKDEVNQLLKQLQNLKIPPTSRGFKKLRDGTKKAFIAVRDSEDIRKRRHNLQELNGQLITALLQSFLPRLDANVKEALVLLRTHRGDDNLNDSGADGSLDGLEYVAHKVQITNRQLLEKLDFAEISMREDNIEQAYPETYCWALRDKSHGFSSWLRYGNGIFWINGQAGSGKSTLMKFLCRHMETHRLLRDWSGKRDFLFGNFYFWYLGTEMQKSIEGLARGLLYKVLTAHIDLAPVAFPDRYSDVVHSNEDSSMRLSYQELVDALRRIAQHDNDSRYRKKVCFFIDGLDEYKGNQLELVGLLRDLARNSKVKLCVSSRPWNAFRNAFDEKVPSLKLEDLTRPDITRYVDGMIRTTYTQLEDVGAEQTADIAKLVEDIVSRSEGVFLWVYLVVKSVVDGIAEGDDVSFLRHRVQTFPSDLEDFFQNMLTRVDSVYKSQSSQALKLACRYQEENGLPGRQASWIDFWFIKQKPQGLEDVRFPYVLDSQNVNKEQTERMLSETRTFLSATCKDLLWLPCPTAILPEAKQATLVSDQRVQFLHRTVYEFLRLERMQTMLNAQVPAHFQDMRVFHLLNLARWKYIDAGMHWNSMESMYNAASMSVVQYHRDLDKEYVDQFDKTLLSCPGPHKFTLEPQRVEILAVLAAFRCTRYLRLALHIFAGKMRDRCDMTPLLIAALGECPLNQFSLDKVDVDLVDLVLLCNGKPHRENPEITRQRRGCSSTIWSIFLRKCALSIHLSNSSEHISCNLQLPLDDKRVCCWQIATRFLKRGASLAEKFCSDPVSTDSNDHVHADQTAEDFLRANIPWQWIEQSGYGALFCHANANQSEVNETAH